MGKWVKSAEYLLEVLVDSLTGFDNVAEHSHRFDFYSYCEHYALERRELMNDLRYNMRKLGYNLSAHGTMLGSAHRLYLDLRGAFDSGIVTALDELIRGETYLAARADAVLEHDRLPPEIYETVRLIRANVSQSLLDLNEMRGHAGAGFAAGSFRLYK